MARIAAGATHPPRESAEARFFAAAFSAGTLPRVFHHTGIAGVLAATARAVAAFVTLFAHRRVLVLVPMQEIYDSLTHMIWRQLRTLDNGKQDEHAAVPDWHERIEVWKLPTHSTNWDEFVADWGVDYQMPQTVIVLHPAKAHPKFYSEIVVPWLAFTKARLLLVGGPLPEGSLVEQIRDHDWIGEHRESKFIDDICK